jgi:hypothetical protein
MIAVTAAKLGPPYEPPPSPDDDLRPVALGPVRDLAIELVNRSRHVPFHVQAAPRRVTFDPATRTLSVELAEDPDPVEAAQSLVGLHLPVVRDVLVPVGESVTVHVVIPATLTEVRDSPAGLGTVATTTVIGNVDRLVLRLAVADVPFQVVTDIPGDEALRLLADTGDVIEAEVALEPSGDTTR